MLKLVKNDSSIYLPLNFEEKKSVYKGARPEKRHKNLTLSNNFKTKIFIFEYFPKFSFRNELHTPFLP